MSGDRGKHLLAIQLKAGNLFLSSLIGQPVGKLFGPVMMNCRAMCRAERYNAVAVGQRSLSTLEQDL